jgi:putative aminopeptidase FrvX
MSIINPNAEQFLEKYLNNASPTGFEAEGQKLWLDYLRPYVDTLHSDNYGTAYGIINPQNDFRVVIEAHADEIAWFVGFISEDGFLSLVRNGGVDPVIAPSKRVNIHTRKGIVRGVFGWPAIHVRQQKENNPLPDVDNVFIDVGAKNKDEVLEMGIHVGCVITYPDPFEVINDRFYCGRALDNRIGGFCIAQVARLLSENQIKLPFALYIVNSVQEEVGLRGAEMITQTIKPHVAIVTDVCHDTSTPMMTAKKQGDVRAGRGPCVSYAPSVHNKLLQLIEDAATDNAIPFQRQAAYRSTGTDTDAFAFSNGGVVSALISLPLRYMHTTVEMAHKEDVENVIRLIYESLQKIDYQHNFKYF